jgi:hypothetical protein
MAPQAAAFVPLQLLNGGRELRLLNMVARLARLSTSPPPNS